MPTKVILPKLGLTMRTGTVVEWIKKEGDRVDQGKPLFSLDSEKVTVEVESPASGILRKIFVPEGGTAPVGHILAIITEENELVENLDELARESRPPPHMGIEQGYVSDQTIAPRVPAGRIPISPSARKLARERNVDLSKLTGSGPAGRIQREDVLRAADFPQRNKLPSTSLTIESTVPLNSIRQTTIERLAQSYSNALQVTLQLDADFTEAKLFREGFAQRRMIHTPSFTDIIIKAAALTLRKVRLLNSVIEGDEIKIMKEINIGIAVSIENGLVVPVIKNADEKNLEVIMNDRRSLTDRARNGRLTIEDVEGGTFTITNLGPYNIDSFSPIINPPQAAILAVGRVVDKPAVVAGQICVRSIGNLSLVFDHRIIDGAGASLFLNKINKLLGEPNELR